MNNSSNLNGCGVVGITDNASAGSVWPQVILYPILLAICTVGNVIVVVVLKREGKAKQSSTHIYLATIAITDFLMM